MKSYRRLESVVRGFSNHRRIQLLEFLDKNPDLSVDEISQALKVHFGTVSAHLRRLTIAGLVSKRSQGPNVRHKLTDRGSLSLEFLKKLENA